MDSSNIFFGSREIFCERFSIDMIVGNLELNAINSILRKNGFRIAEPSSDSRDRFDNNNNADSTFDIEIWFVEDLVICVII